MNWPKCCWQALSAIRCVTSSRRLQDSAKWKAAATMAKATDVEHRKPSIRNAKRCLNWTPTVKMEQTIDETLDFFLRTVELSEQAS